ncbi:MAG: hypothetical protein ACLUUO_05550 [Sellimonas intestinalis]
MINLKGTLVLGSSWWLPCYYGRGSTKSQIFQKKQEMSSAAFAQNYESKWVGSSDGALVDVNKLLNCRTLTSPAVNYNKYEEENYIGVDVARSQKPIIINLLLSWAVLFGTVNLTESNRLKFQILSLSQIL